MTKCERILRHLQDYWSITTFEAYQEYGITRLASRICDLKQSGYDIRRTFETAKNRYGDTVSFCRYTLGASYAIYH